MRLGVGRRAATRRYRRSEPSAVRWRADPEPGRTPLRQRVAESYGAEVPVHLLGEQCRLIGQRISVAFDETGAHHLEVRVRAAER